MSDLTIPSRRAILAACADTRETAVRIGDEAAIRQVDRLIASVKNGARFRWELGVLIVDSPSGGRYHVSRAGCDCPNRQRACWHWMLFNTLLDLFDTAVETADMDYAVAQLGRRIALARRALA